MSQCDRCGTTEGLLPSLSLYELCPSCEDALRREHAVYATRPREKEKPTMACERCWSTRGVMDATFRLCIDCVDVERKNYEARKALHDRALDAPIECETVELINSTERAIIERDRQVAEAARAFWASRQWFGMYMDGFRPQHWPEYDQLAQAILHHKRPTIDAGQLPWRIRLARWLVGF